jgi:hypothetical protein
MNVIAAGMPGVFFLSSYPLTTATQADISLRLRTITICVMNNVAVEQYFQYQLQRITRDKRSDYFHRWVGGSSCLVHHGSNGYLLEQGVPVVADSLLDRSRL